MAMQVLVAGSAHLVVGAREGNAPLAHTGLVSITVGGAAYEAAICLKMLGAEVRLLTAWSDSELSRLIGSHISASGIALLSDEVAGMETGAVVTHYGANGQPGASVEAMPLAAYEFADDRLRQAVAGAETIYIDTSLSASTLVAIATSASESMVPVIAIGVAGGTVSKLAQLADMLTAVVLRPTECEELLEHLDAADPCEIAQRLNAMVFVMRGERGAVIYEPDGERLRVMPPRDDRLPFGQGFVFALGVISRLIQRESLQDAANAAHEMALEFAAREGGGNGLNRMVQGLVDQAERDRLTGLLSRAGLANTFARTGNPICAVLLIDLDNFKSVNDSLGHDAGDTVLCKAAAVISNSIRGSDMACRWGGDEFLVVLASASVALAKEIADRMRRAAASLELEGVTFSIGVALARRGEEFGAVVRRADAAMYRAKRTGKDGVSVCSEV